MFAALLFNQPLTLKLVYHAQAPSRNRTILHAPFLSTVRLSPRGPIRR